MPPQPCSVCEEVAGRITAPGGVIYDDGYWTVAHHTGPYTDRGELIVMLRRHCESLSGLTEPEAEALGPVLRSAVGAIEQVVRPERVYTACYGERVRHVHFFLLPRTTALPAGHIVSDIYRRARTLLRSWGLVRNPPGEARTEMAGRIRESDLWKRSSI
jgi:diadenosine tetraphosphate (Ap4A) HIT family hydrolase